MLLCLIILCVNCVFTSNVCVVDLRVCLWCVALVLYIIGGKSLEGFSLALIVGVIIGTYSSIYVATTSVLFLDVSTKDLMPIQQEKIDDGMP